MRMISKKRLAVLCSNSGETMVEVLVAFTLLSMMLIIFSQGIAWASRSEIQATGNRNKADSAMTELQTKLANEEIQNPSPLNIEGYDIKRYVVHTSEGYSYVIYKYEST